MTSKIVISCIVLMALTLAYSFYSLGASQAYTMFLYLVISLGRISLVFVISLLIGLFAGVFAATNKTAGRILIPLFDILQSVPILGYFPVLLVIIITSVPGFLGRELAVWVLLFTAIEWSIFFGVSGAVKSIPSSVREAAISFNLSGYNYFKNVILPAIIPALVSACTLAWNDGWTFDIASEFVSFNGTNYSVPGIGSFIAYSSLVKGDIVSSWLGLFLVGEMVVLTNQVIWHRVAELVSMHRPVFSIHVPERVVHPLRSIRAPARRIFGLRFRVEMLGTSRFKNSVRTSLIASFFAVVLLLVLLSSNLSEIIPAFSSVALLISSVNPVATLVYTLFTLGRLFVTYLFVLFLSIAVAIIASQRRGFRRVFYSLYDVGRAIPYLALFPPLFVTLNRVMPGELGLEISSFFLLMMGMIWYVIYNVVTAASYIPSELKEVSELFNFRGMKYLRHILMPYIMPAVVTGSILAWGGGWNVVIYSEYVSQGDKVYSLPGLGYLLDVAANQGNSALVIFYLFIMSGIVIIIGRLVWRRLIERVERRGLELS